MYGPGWANLNKRALRWVRDASDAMLFQTLFGAFLLTFLILFISETAWEGSVYPHINLRNVLIATVLTGVLALNVVRRSLPYRAIGRAFMGSVAAVGITSAAIVWYHSRHIGWAAYGFALIAGVTVMVVVVMVYDED